MTNKSKKELIQRFSIKETDVAHVYLAMDVYAKQEAIAFANWLSHTGNPNNKPIHKLWDDFEETYKFVTQTQ